MLLWPRDAFVGRLIVRAVRSIRRRYGKKEQYSNKVHGREHNKIDLVSKRHNHLGSLH